MSTTTRVLVVGGNGDEIAALGAVVDLLLDGRCDTLAMQLDTSSVDPTLAWGTEGPRVVELTRTTAHRAGEVGQEQPLPEDGDSWKAITAAAERYDVHLIAAVQKRQRWLSRLLSGSAARDLLDRTDWPLLLIPPEALQRRPSTDQPTAVISPSTNDDTIEPGEGLDPL